MEEIVSLSKNTGLFHTGYTNTSKKYLKLTLTVNSHDPKEVHLSAGVFFTIKSLSKMVRLCPFFCRLFDSSEEQAEHSEEDKPESVSPQPVSQSYAATVALSSTPPSSATLLGIKSYYFGYTFWLW